MNQKDTEKTTQTLLLIKDFYGLGTIAVKFCLLQYCTLTEPLPLSDEEKENQEALFLSSNRSIILRLH